MANLHCNGLVDPYSPATLPAIGYSAESQDLARHTPLG